MTGWPKLVVYEQRQLIKMLMAIPKRKRRLLPLRRRMMTKPQKNNKLKIKAKSCKKRRPSKVKKSMPS